MPTGYTAGIIDGEIKDFTQFATLCMRAFGATIHMRDDGLTEPYVKREPSDYHTKEIEKAKAQLSEAKSMSPKEIIAFRSAALKKDREYHQKAIVRTNENRNKLMEILRKAKSYQPPTEDHTGIKEFMIQQLTETIKYDGETKYHDENLMEIENELSSLNAAKIRKDLIQKANRDLKYHMEEQEKEVKRCEDSNRWVEQFIESLPKQRMLLPNPPSE
jgi:hypothetical protein